VKRKQDPEAEITPSFSVFCHGHAALVLTISSLRLRAVWQNIDRVRP